ncbi:MAG: thermonuclease family protein [Elusimicrobia bacterium]|nr:thermonuclease family protein [Elusimicrobiota bacterium]
MITTRVPLAVALALSLNVAALVCPATAQEPEESRDGAQRLWDLLERKFKDEKGGEAWLNRKFRNDEWFGKIKEREVRPKPAPAPTPPGTSLPSEGAVTDVADGDTLVVAGVGKIRLQGVDTTEKLHPTKPIQYLSEEASAFTRRVALGQRVRLEYGKELYDKYGRVLAYVYLPDGRMLNAELIREGLGYSYTRYPHKHRRQFDALEEDAQKRNVGLWADHGLGEYHWLRAQNRGSFEVFAMSSNLWGVQWADLVLLRLTTDQLRLELEHLQKDVHTYGPRDLEKELTGRGYQKVPRGNS